MTPFDDNYTPEKYSALMREKASIDRALSCRIRNHFSHYGCTQLELIFSEKLTFGLSLMRAFIDSFLEPASAAMLMTSRTENDHQRPGLEPLRRALESSGAHFIQRVIDETLATPDKHIGYHLLSVPHVLRKLHLPNQVIYPGSFEAYVNKLAPIAVDYKFCKDPHRIKLGLDNSIDKGMTYLYQKVSQKHTIHTSLINIDLQLADQLVTWGLDVRAIINPSDKQLEFSLERDLGL